MAFNPYFFNDSPTAMELIYKALADLKVLNPTVAELKKKVDELLNKLDDSIKEEVSKVIEQMYESGEFERILKIEAQKYLADLPLNCDVDYRRIYRRCHIIGDGRIYFASQEARPSRVQGGTVVDYNGFRYLVYALIPSPTSNNYSGVDNAGVIVAYNENTGEVVGQVKVTMGHMNSMAFNKKDGYLYVAWTLADGAGSQSTDGGKVSRFQFSEMLGLNPNVEDYTEQMEGITYETFSVFNDGRGVGNLSYDNDLNANELYLGGRSYVLKWDFTTNTEIERITPPEIETIIENYKVSTGFEWQNAIIKNGYMYLLTYRKSQIFRCNLTTDEIEYIYNLPVTMDNNNYSIGEPEALFLDDDGYMYIFSAVRINDKTYAEMDMAQIFKQNIFNNDLPLTKVKITDRKRATVYVANTNTGYNPDGTSANPFRYVNEAVYWGCTQENYDGCTIVLLTDSNWFVQISTSKNIRIVNSSTPTSPYVDEYGRAAIGGIHCNGCGTVTLSGLRVHHSLVDGRQNSQIYALDGNFIFNNLKLIRNNTSVTTAYSMNYANVILTGADNFTVGKVQEDVGVLWGGSYFMTGTAFSANCHGFANNNAAIIG